MYFEYDGKKYEIVIQKKNNKNTYIRVKEDLKIYVTTSKFTPKFMIQNLINSNRNVIINMIEKQKKELNKFSDNYYLGKKIDVMIINIVKKPHLEDNTLYVKSKSDIDKWYKKQTEIVFKEHLDNVYNRFTMDIPYPSLTIRKMKTRWGVCNKKLEKITLNSNLIYMDPKYLDYVIVHELSHFIHFDHSKSFWKLVSENEPNYKIIRKEMRE